MAAPFTWGSMGKIEDAFHALVSKELEETQEIADLVGSQKLTPEEEITDLRDRISELSDRIWGLHQDMEQRIREAEDNAVERVMNMAYTVGKYALYVGALYVMGSIFGWPDWR
jgi:NTP pyrophosphatase (non-canonical NTP hydrolase)